MYSNAKFDVTDIAAIKSKSHNTLEIDISMTDTEAMDAVREIVQALPERDREALLAELAAHLIEAAHDAGVEEGEQQH